MTKAVEGQGTRTSTLSEFSVSNSKDGLVTCKNGMPNVLDDQRVRPSVNSATQGWSLQVTVSHDPWARVHSLPPALSQVDQHVVIGMAIEAG